MRSDVRLESVYKESSGSALSKHLPELQIQNLLKPASDTPPALRSGFVPGSPLHHCFHLAYFQYEIPLSSIHGIHIVKIRFHLTSNVSQVCCRSDAPLLEHLSCPLLIPQLTPLLHRRSSHKPSEAFLNAFKDRYGNTAPAEQGASPAVTPFLLGPPPPGVAPSALTDSTYACPASTLPRNEVLAPAHHVTEDVHHSDTFTSSHNLDDDEQRFDNSQFDLGGYHKHHFMEDQLFDLDPNGLDFTFGGGWAPSPHGQLSLPRQLSSATALTGASALGTPTSIGLSESATAAHFIKHTLSNHTAFNTFGVLQHMGPVEDPYHPSLDFMSNIQSFDPQDSMLQQHQQHQQEGNGMVPAPAFPMTGSFNFPPALRDQTARPSTRSEREQEQ